MLIIIIIIFFFFFFFEYFIRRYTGSSIKLLYNAIS